MTKHNEYCLHARRTANGWIQLAPIAQPRPSWIARFIAWILE